MFDHTHLPNLGLTNGKIPPEATLDFDVELISFAPRKKEKHEMKEKDEMKDEKKEKSKEKEGKDVEKRQNDAEKEHSEQVLKSQRRKAKAPAVKPVVAAVQPTAQAKPQTPSPGRGLREVPSDESHDEQPSRKRFKSRAGVDKGGARRSKMNLSREPHMQAPPFKIAKTNEQCDIVICK